MRQFNKNILTLFALALTTTEEQNMASRLFLLLPLSSPRDMVKDSIPVLSINMLSSIIVFLRFWTQ